MFEILGITFHWYGLLIGLGVVTAIEIVLYRSEKSERENLENAIWWVILAGIIGARLYHVIDFWGRYYSTNIIKILYFWEGGLGIWGAIACGVLGLSIYCYFNKLKFWKYLDVMVIGVPLAQAIGRMGNYVNGELWGKNGEPLFAYEGLLNLVLFGVLWKVSTKKHKSGTLSGIYLIGYGVIRTLLENLRPDGTIWKLGGVPMAIIFSAVAILVGGYLIFRKRQS